MGPFFLVFFLSTYFKVVQMVEVVNPIKTNELSHATLNLEVVILGPEVVFESLSPSWAPRNGKAPSSPRGGGTSTLRDA